MGVTGSPEWVGGGLVLLVLQLLPQDSLGSFPPRFLDDVTFLVTSVHAIGSKAPSTGSHSS